MRQLSRPATRVSGARCRRALATGADVGCCRRVTENRTRSWLAAILLAALVVRVTAIVVTGPTALRFGDAQDYVGAAVALCADGRYPDRGSLPFFRAPGLPLFLAAATLCHPQNVIAAKLALALCDVATAALAAVLTLQLFGHAARPAATIAAALVAIDPFLVLASSDVTSEPLTTLLLTAALCALLGARQAGCSSAAGAGTPADVSRRGGGPILACAGGAMLGLACLTRPGVLAVAPAWLLLPALGVPRGSDARGRPRWHTRMLPLIVAGCGLIATIAPWSWRNWRHFDEPIVVNDAGGYNAWRGTHPRLHEMLATTDPSRFAADSRQLEQDLEHLAREHGLGSEASPGARDRGWWAAARANLAADRARGARIVVRNLGAFFRPWLDPAAHGSATVAISGLWFVSLSVLALAGTRAIWSRDRSAVVLLASGVLLVALAHVPFQAVLRFRLPFTEPLLLVLAAGGASACVDALRPVLAPRARR